MLLLGVSGHWQLTVRPYHGNWFLATEHRFWIYLSKRFRPLTIQSVNSPNCGSTQSSTLLVITTLLLLTTALELWPLNIRSYLTFDFRPWLPSQHSHMWFYSTVYYYLPFIPRNCSSGHWTSRSWVLSLSPHDVQASDQSATLCFNKWFYQLIRLYHFFLSI